MSKRKTLNNKGRLIVVSAPSGAGKTTVVTKLLSVDRNLKKTISHTTRRPRPGERSGRDYYFVSQPVFERMIAKKEFVEWAKVYGNLYGTSHRTIRTSIAKGKDVLLVIEAQGARAIRKIYPDAAFILLLPPSLRELRRRLSSRPGTTSKELRRRLSLAQKEIAAMQWYDFVVTNDDLGQAVKALIQIVSALRHKMDRANIL